MVNISNIFDNKHISEAFKNKRNESGLTIEQVSLDLNIRKIYIKYIEGESIDENTIPRVYINGYIKMYAKYLDMDLSVYNLCTNDYKESITKDFNKKINKHYILICIIIIALLTIIINILISNKDISSNLNSTIFGNHSKITFKATNDIYIYLITNQGKVSHRYRVLKDQSLSMDKIRNLHVVVDNPLNVELYIEGKKYNKLLNKFINLDKIYKDNINVLASH